MAPLARLWRRRLPLLLRALAPRSASPRALSWGLALLFPIALLEAALLSSAGLLLRLPFLASSSALLSLRSALRGSGRPSLIRIAWRIDAWRFGSFRSPRELLRPLLPTLPLLPILLLWRVAHLLWLSARDRPDLFREEGLCPWTAALFRAALSESDRSWDFALDLSRRSGFPDPLLPGSLSFPAKALPLLALIPLAFLFFSAGKKDRPNIRLSLRAASRLDLQELSILRAEGGPASPPRDRFIASFRSRLESARLSERLGPASAASRRRSL